MNAFSDSDATGCNISNDSSDQDFFLESESAVCSSSVPPCHYTVIDCSGLEKESVREFGSFLL